MKQNKCAYTSSQLETTMCLQFWKLENISMCLTSVCIKETVYWTELANQTQNTIYYMVWNIHLTWLAHRTRNPLLHWGTGPPSGPLWKWHFPLGVCCSDVTMVQFQMVSSNFTRTLISALHPHYQLQVHLQYSISFWPREVTRPFTLHGSAKGHGVVVFWGWCAIQGGGVDGGQQRR